MSETETTRGPRHDTIAAGLPTTWEGTTIEVEHIHRKTKERVVTTLHADDPVTWRVDPS